MPVLRRFSLRAKPPAKIPFCRERTGLSPAPFCSCGTSCSGSTAQESMRGKDRASARRLARHIAPLRRSAPNLKTEDVGTPRFGRRIHGDCPRALLSRPLPGARYPRQRPRVLIAAPVSVKSTFPYVACALDPPGHPGAGAFRDEEMILTNVREKLVHSIRRFPGASGCVVFRERY